MILADYLAATGTTVTAFAERIGKPVSTVHAWVTGAREPSLRAVAEIDAATEGRVTARDWIAAQRTIGAAKAAMSAEAAA